MTVSGLKRLPFPLRPPPPAEMKHVYGSTCRQRSSFSSLESSFCNNVVEVFHHRHHSLHRYQHHFLTTGLEAMGRNKCSLWSSFSSCYCFFCYYYYYS